MIQLGNEKIKTNILQSQEKHIENLEKILEKARISHQQLRNRVEAVEYDAIKIREKILFNQIDINKENPSNKSRIVKTFKKTNQK